MAFGYDPEEERQKNEYQVPESAPIEPEKSGPKRFGFFKLFFFFVIAAYLVFNIYQVPILTHLGQYLVVKDHLEKADLIVCLAGNNVERGLATIDAYRQGLAPVIYNAREELPDGYEALKTKGLHYPETRELLLTLFKEADVPASALVPEPAIATSTFEEAQFVGALVKQKGYRSLIIITSPTHARRALLTFNKVFKDQNIKIMMLPSPYSQFNPQSWWKERKYVREVVMEYQKLIYYTFKYFL
jgi:uncharacterized SAM-binding protein YcdF (DUF218 family)